MACTKTFATLTIHSPVLSPAEIGERLGLSPTRTSSKDPASRYRHVREWNRWHWSTEALSSSVETLDHVRMILAPLEGKADALRALRESQCEMYVFCFWDFADQGGIWLDVESMEKLVQLGLDICWDIYGGASESSESQAIGGGSKQ